MSKQLVATDVRLHLDDAGFVWYDHDEGRPVNSNLKQQEFVESGILQRAQRARVLGVPRNAALIVSLYIAHKKGLLRRVQIGSPMICHPVPLSELSAEHVLRQMRLMVWTPSCGGWHDMLDLDAATYGICATPDADLKEAGLLPALLRHPVSVVLGFAGNEDVSVRAGLIRSILDPRWYVDRQNPNSPNRLYSYMGLNDSNMKKIFSDTTGSSRHEGRAQLVVSAWRGGLPDPLPHGWEGWPYFFAWRQYNSFGADARAALRTSQRFLNLVSSVWLQAAVPYRVMFVPKYFFTTEAEVGAWKQHTAPESPKLTAE